MYKIYKINKSIYFKKKKMIIFSEKSFFSISLKNMKNMAMKQKSITYITNKIDNNNNPFFCSINSNITKKYEQNNYIDFLHKEKIKQLLQKVKDKNNRNNQIINIKKDNRNNNKSSFDSSKDNNKNKNLNIIKNEQNLKEILKTLANDKNKKYITDSLSEVINFKTELCHSWELTGTCKYGQNVKIYIFI